MPPRWFSSAAEGVPRRTSPVQPPPKTGRGSGRRSQEPRDCRLRLRCGRVKRGERTESLRNALFTSLMSIQAQRHPYFLDTAQVQTDPPPRPTRMTGSSPLETSSQIFVDPIPVRSDTSETLYSNLFMVVLRGSLDFRRKTPVF